MLKSLLLGVSLLGVCWGEHIKGLKSGWTVGLADSDTTFPATVPGGIFSDLLANGNISDIFWDRGDKDYAWIGESDWTYTTNFKINEDELQKEAIMLVFEGLDTFATVLVNNEVVGTADNMFRPWLFSIKDHVQQGQNKLEVRFVSPVQRAKELATNPNNSYVIPPECPPDAYNGICYVNRIRKMQSSFSWDWGPAFASMGIWKNVSIQATNTYIFNDLFVTKTYDAGTHIWSVQVNTILNGGTSHFSGDGTINVTIHVNNDRTYEDSKDLGAHFVDTSYTVYESHFDIHSDEVDLWWPNGYGEQPLYEVHVLYSGVGETFEKSVRIGFRTVELLQDQLGNGLTFQFQVNGYPIFAKGSNEIPVNILPEKGQEEAAIRNLLKSAKDANMNMLRVWGGGVYESDLFYDMADEYGILIWQDFAFASALYPADDDFVRNAFMEAHLQMYRLGNHPSLAVLSGNNENEAALAYNWFNTSDNLENYQNDYRKLYIDNVKKAITSSTFGDWTIWVPSSPSNGVKTEDEDSLSENPGDELYGDVHFYDYKSDSWAIETFPVPRFASEYGYQSVPSTEAWLTATDSLDAVLDHMLNERQHHPGGNQEKLDLITQQLALPDQSNANFLQALIYFSQIIQAQSIKIETEHYRSFKGRLDDQGRGATAGALFWQLNDVWVAPTWSAIDFTGRWKMLQYQAKDFFAPNIVTGRFVNDQLEIYAIVDGLEVPTGSHKVRVHIHEWASFEPHATLEFPVELSTTEAVLVTTIDVKTNITEAGCGDTYEEARKNCLYHMHLLDADDKEIGPINYVFLEKLKNSNLKDAKVAIDSVSPVDGEDNQFEIVITTDVPSLFVWLDSHDIRGQFSENGFIGIFNVPKTIVFTAEGTITADDLKAALTITHLRESLYL